MVRHEGVFKYSIESKEHKSALNEYIQSIANTRNKNSAQELELGKKSGENIEFLFTHHKNQDEKSKIILFHSQNAEPMRLALQGKSGTIIGRDYKGEMVLAAYEPIDAKKMGLVEKIDLAAIRAPFIKSALILSAIISILMLAAIFLITRLGNPIILSLKKNLRDLKLSEQHLRLHYNQHLVGMLAFDRNACVSEWNIACKKIFGYSHEEAIGQQISNLVQCIKLIADMPGPCVHAQLSPEFLLLILSKQMAFYFHYAPL